MKKLTLTKETLQALSADLQAHVAAGDPLSAYKTHCTSCSYYLFCKVKVEEAAE